jgi:Mn2+/Fe2+ NRAMP family transporter
VPAPGGHIRLLTLIGPGLLVAATGVGAGDLATASFTGSRLGVAVLWAVVLGAFLKFVLNEGLARWQLATGQTLLEGAVRHLGRPVEYAFLAYLLLWSFFVGQALISACGVAAHALLPVFADARDGKIVFGIVHSLAGLVLVRLGGYRLFAKVMSVCIAVMFAVVLVTAVALEPDWGAVLRGLLVPGIPKPESGGLAWTVALMGGVGGTLTVLCYGYWIREEGREGASDLALCRVDLAVAYAMTALFGLAMVSIGSNIHVEGGGAGLLVNLADALQSRLGTAARWVFLVGAWAALFSSLLGVWQSVPYVFADFWGLRRLRGAGSAETVRVDTEGAAYRGYLYALALVPLLGLYASFENVQKAYAVLGALFMPMLALALLLLNGNAQRVGPEMRNRPATTAVLVLTLLLFAYFGWLEASSRI